MKTKFDEFFQNQRFSRILYKFRLKFVHNSGKSLILTKFVKFCFHLYLWVFRIFRRFFVQIEDKCLYFSNQKFFTTPTSFLPPYLRWENPLKFTCLATHTLVLNQNSGLKTSWGGWKTFDSKNIDFQLSFAPRIRKESFKVAEIATFRQQFISELRRTCMEDILCLFFK